jgi:dsDNA-specific endonuclease/ATPase MutS2
LQQNLGGQADSLTGFCLAHTIPKFQQEHQNASIPLNRVTMQRQAFDTLEFEQLKAVLLQRIRTPLGVTLAAALPVSTDPAEIVRELRRTSEGVTYLREGTALDLNDMPDPRPALGKLSIADVNLEPLEILNVFRLISVALGLRETFRYDERTGGADLYPLIRALTDRIPNLRAVYQRLRTRISPTGEIEDFASPGLREARFQPCPHARDLAAPARKHFEKSRRIARRCAMTLLLSAMTGMSSRFATTIAARCRASFTECLLRVRPRSSSRWKRSI